MFLSALEQSGESFRGWVLPPSKPTPRPPTVNDTLIIAIQTIGCPQGRHMANPEPDYGSRKSRFRTKSPELGAGYPGSVSRLQPV
jgi:hypothetical protein